MRLLLVEDDEVIARELQLRWRGRGWMVNTCGCVAIADWAMTDGSGQGYDVIVLDLGLPDGDGLEWLRRLRERDRQTPTLVLTARDTVADRVLGLRSGADDYLVKPFAAEELDARIEVLVRRTQPGAGMLRFGRIAWHGGDGVAFIGDQPMELAPREFEVLGLLIRHAPRLVAKRALIEALTAKNLDVGDSAAEVYVSRLRRKLAGSGVSIRTMRGFGYLLVPEDAPPSAAPGPAPG